MKIELENITNARDLGGMNSADGKKIKAKKLIRSSCLFGASEKDISTLQKDYHLTAVIDFRSENERVEKPHPITYFDKAKYYYNPCFLSIQSTVTRDKKSEYMLLKNSENLTVDMAIQIIENFYETLATLDSIQQAYKKFFEILLNNEEGSTLWHCSLGKDRAGIASVLIEKVLGVNDNDIMQDYLLTNKNIDQNVERTKNNAFRVFYGVRESFLNRWYDAINKNWGSFDNYYKKALNLNEEKISKLKRMYLE